MQKMATKSARNRRTAKLGGFSDINVKKKGQTRAFIKGRNYIYNYITAKLADSPFMFLQKTWDCSPDW